MYASSVGNTLFFSKIAVPTPLNVCFSQEWLFQSLGMSVFLKNGCSNPLERLFFSKMIVPTPWNVCFSQKRIRTVGGFACFSRKRMRTVGGFACFSRKRMRTVGEFTLLYYSRAGQICFAQKKSGGMHQTHAPIIIKRVIKLG